MVSCKKSKIVYFTSLITENITLLLLPSRFPVRLICCIAFRSASSACYLFKSIGIIL